MSFDQLLEEMEAENAVGLLLAAQLDGSPDNLRLVVQSTLFEQALGALRPRNQYMIRATGVAEHGLTLGLFNEIGLVETHPLLYHFNSPRANVFIASSPADPGTVLGEIVLAHREVYDLWREIEMDLNKLTAPEKIFESGYGLLGEMPQPFAEAVAQVLTRHGVQHSLIAAQSPSAPMKLLLLDDSYIVASEIVLVAPDDASED